MTGLVKLGILVALVYLVVKAWKPLAVIFALALIAGSLR